MKLDKKLILGGLLAGSLLVSGNSAMAWDGGWHPAPGGIRREFRSERRDFREDRRDFYRDRRDYGWWWRRYGASRPYGWWDRYGYWHHYGW
ncbi:MAG TPA: hypothetical protein VGL11_11420 [Candidatus Binatia bacterium]|jgi:hypothetical protein